MLRNIRLTVFAALLVAPVAADDVPFVRHVLNRNSEFSAAAVLDVDRDGTLDIVCGGWWYRGPNWQKQAVREVELIRGRYDDYASLPLDVNGDGWLDLISVNYRSQSLYWVEHPGPALGTWTKHVIDTPGPSESGRLVDIDGDRQLDVLPNGTSFAAWYELVREKVADGVPAIRWLRHDLPKELAGHGIGCGDIDGDGRGDLVGPNGWARGPAQPRTQRWEWRPEFQLHRDCALPILVHDVDRDGDADLIWSRGHNLGLYWLEQDQNEAGSRRWQSHVLDTSWSQAHSLLLADIDGDGHDDLVAGKRYLGHDGKDPGEYDPLVIYWYAFQPRKKTWQRHLVSWGADCGFDLDPKCADLDGDGDLDIIAPARSGLFVLENRRIARTAAAGPISSQPPAVPEYEDHHDLTYYLDDQGQRRPIHTAWDWGIRRQHILANMERVMGPLPAPDRRVPLAVEITGDTDVDSYIRRQITFAAEAGDRVPALLLIPKNLTGPAPAMLCLHPTSPLGKNQVCGIDGRPSRFYAHELAQRGYVCLAPDYPSFGDYRGYDFANDAHVSGTMKGIWNHIRAIDLLESLPEVAKDQIGCIGHSLGGHNALFVAAFDQRLRAVVTSCGFNAFEDYYGGNLRGWTGEVYMPRIRDIYESDWRRLPFDFHEILAAMSPRPVFINAPLHDANFAVAGVRKTVASALPIYRLQDAESKLHVEYPDAEHDFPDDVRQRVYRWLDERLK